MRWLLALVLIGFSGYFLYTWHQRVSGAHAVIPQKKGREDLADSTLLKAGLSEAPKPAAEGPAPKSTPDVLLNPADISRIRASATATNPEVRWTAMELLFTMRDPAALGIVQKAVSDDPSPELRLKAVQLLASQPDPITFQKLVRGVSDPDKDVKIASLRALGASGDPAAAPYITGALKDFDSDVKMEALKALGGLEDKRTAEFNALAAKLRHDYEEAVKRARAAQERQ